MRVCFLRHAQAEHNAATLRLGSVACESWDYKDALLTPLGHAQAAAVILPFVPDHVYCSPLRRCIQTIRHALPTTPLILHDGLLERQGQHPCNVRDSKSNLVSFDEFLDFSLLPDETHNYAYPFEIREPHDALKKRVMAAFEEIYVHAGAARATKILIVGHCDAFDSALGVRLKNTELYERFVTPAASQESGN